MLIELFTQFIYQPFFNVLVFLYWVMDVLPGVEADMGVAVIFLTIVIRVLLIPLSLAGDKSERQRRAIAQEIQEIEKSHTADPIVLRQKRKLTLQKSKGVLLAEVFNLFIQVSIALMLWRIFATGLEGKDFHLIYPFMPNVDTNFNLMFLGKYDLSHTNFTLNLLQSFSIFILETLQILTSPFRHSRGEVVRYQLVLPVVSFLIFMGLPAGKKLFVITALWFSIILTIYKFFHNKYLDYVEKVAREQVEADAAAAAGQPNPIQDRVLVEMK